MRAEFNEFAGGARCFVIGPIKDPGFNKTFEVIKATLEQDSGLRCFRAHEIDHSGKDMLSKIHDLIELADLVIADLSIPSANIYYEYGYSTAHRRTPIVICKREETELPIDVKGLEILRYTEPAETDAEFLLALRRHVRSRLSSAVPELRRALPGEIPFPTYVVSAMRVPRHTVPALPYHGTVKTSFAENRGISGILGGFGLLFGVDRRPELVHAKFGKNIQDEDANYFLIGSPKVNKLTEVFLERIQNGLNPVWSMPERGKDARVIIRCAGDARYKKLNQILAKRVPGSGPWTKSFSDYGIVIRAPNPSSDSNGRLVTIMAGRHSVGTHAACMLLTEPVLIERLGKKLGVVPGGKGALNSSFEQVSVLAQKQIPFWAIVKGTVRFDKKGFASVGTKDVTIVNAKRYGRK